MWGLGSQNPGPSPSPAQCSEEAELSKPVLTWAPAQVTAGKAHCCPFLPVWSRALTTAPGSYSPRFQPASWSCPRRAGALLLTLLTAEASHPNPCQSDSLQTQHVPISATLEPHDLPLSTEGWEPTSSSDS